MPSNLKNPDGPENPDSKSALHHYNNPCFWIASKWISTDSPTFNWHMKSWRGESSRLLTPKWETISCCWQNALSMTFHLDQGRQASSNPLEDQAIQFVHSIHTGRPGWPRVEIEPTLLSTALALCVKTQVAKTAGCSAWTIRRRQLEYGIEIPQPSHSQTQQASGDNSVSSGEISDEELDWCLAIIIQDFSTFRRLSGLWFSHPIFHFDFV